MGKHLDRSHGAHVTPEPGRSIGYTTALSIAIATPLPLQEPGRLPRLGGRGMGWGPPFQRFLRRTSDPREPWRVPTSPEAGASCGPAAASPRALQSRLRACLLPSPVVSPCTTPHAHECSLLQDVESSYDRPLYRPRSGGPFAQTVKMRPYAPQRARMCLTGKRRAPYPVRRVGVVPGLIGGMHGEGPPRLPQLWEGDRSF